MSATCAGTVGENTHVPTPARGEGGQPIQPSASSWTAGQEPLAVKCRPKKKKTRPRCTSKIYRRCGPLNTARAYFSRARRGQQTLQRMHSRAKL